MTTDTPDDLALVDDAIDVGALVDDEPTAVALVRTEQNTDPAPAGRVDLLPAEFQLPPLVRFVPNPSIKAALDQAVASALAVRVEGEAGIAQADAALGNLRDAMKATEAHFEDPAKLANDEHKRITGTRAEWLRGAIQAAQTLGAALVTEAERLKRAALAKAAAEQEALDREARAHAAQEAQLAEAAGAPTAVVEALQEHAATVTAAPVAPVEVGAGLARSTVTKAWKARLHGTAPGAEINPSAEDLTPAQVPHFEALLRAVLEGRTSRGCLAINWSYLDKRAKADKSAMQIPGVEAFQIAGTRAKGGRA